MLINDTDFNVRNSFEQWMNGINQHKENTGLTIFPGVSVLNGAIISAPTLAILPILILAPALKVAAFLIFATNSAGIGSPVLLCTK